MHYAKVSTTIFRRLQKQITDTIHKKGVKAPRVMNEIKIVPMNCIVQ